MYCAFYYVVLQVILLLLQTSFFNDPCNLKLLLLSGFGVLSVLYHLLFQSHTVSGNLLSGLHSYDVTANGRYIFVRAFFFVNATMFIIFIFHLENNLDTTRVLIGQKPMGYCAGKLTMRKLLVLTIVI